MKTKILLPIFAFCVLTFCGCSKSEQLPTVDIVPSIPSVTESKVSTQCTKAEDACETEVTEPQALVSADKVVSTATATESLNEQAESDVFIKETKPGMPEPNPTEGTIPPTTAPAITEPPATEAIETEPSATEPEESTPSEQIPSATEPMNTEPPATDPPEAEPETEIIDTAALESYGRSYASSTYGYNGASACHPGTGAGFFPAATKEITSMEEGYSIVRQAIDSQYKRDMAYGYIPYEEIDGQIVRCPINVSVASAGGNTYTVTVYYGGTA